MAQNRSTAVMNRKRPQKTPAQLLNLFPTPPWATRAFCEFLTRRYGSLKDRRAWEPAAGLLDMAKPLGEFFGAVEATDVYQHCEGLDALCDFIAFPGSKPYVDADWIITNPPFRLAEEFIARALECCGIGCAMLVRISFLESVGRYERVWSKTPPAWIVQYSERVDMVEGRLRNPEDDEGEGATAYCWLVFEKKPPRRQATRFDWIAPCRNRLERPGDYPAKAPQDHPEPMPLFEGE